MMMRGDLREKGVAGLNTPSHTCTTGGGVEGVE